MHVKNGMRSFESLLRRRWFEAAVVLVPLLAVIVVQHELIRRLTRVEAIAHQTTLLDYLDAVTAGVRRTYEGAAREMLDVPGDALAAGQFDVVARHFDGVDTSAASLLFAGSLEGCSCLTRYFDPETGRIGPAADRSTELVALRVGTLLRLQRMLHLNRSEIYVDELDAGNRVLYRFVTDADAVTVGFAGFVVDRRRFEREYLPRAIAAAEAMLADDVRDNLLLRVTDGAGRVVASTHDGPGQADALTDRFDFVFRDFELSARSRHTAAAQVLQANALTRRVLSVLMAVMAGGGVLLTWRAARRERRLSRIRNGFVTGVSHELRTPLASIAVFGELLRRRRVAAPDRVVEYGRRIEQESARLRRLIDNVLSFGRIEAAQVRYRPEAAAIEDVVGAALAAVETRRADGRFTIAVASPDAGLPEVRVDAAAMTQVFVNLLDNAMKYSGRCRCIRMRLRRRGAAVEVAVADGGVGIAPNDQGRIFDEFYRAPAGNSGVPGTGLGLAIARHVVRAHGGRIAVDSRPGHGATFTVVLPAVAVPVRRQVRVPSVVDRPRIEARA